MTNSILTAHFSEVYPTIAACIPPATYGITSSDKRVSLNKARKMFRE